MVGKKRLLTGLQSSGQLHIGNYFGALKPFTDLYRDYESFLMVVDYHALTTVRDPKVMHADIIDAVRTYLAIGIDPKVATIFQQSQVSEHTELAWILECMVTVPFLMQAHSYKDKVAKGLDANAGLFNYPMLMAADILLYDTDVVPVGQDQRQHVEYAREAASKFNKTFGKTFVEPKEKIAEMVATVPGTDGQKMSKSYKNTIPLFGSKDEIAKAVKSIVTNSTGTTPANVYAIHLLFEAESPEFHKLYNENDANHKLLKEALIEAIDKKIAPMREKFNSITEAEVSAVLKDGSERAKEIASKKMEDVRAKLGIAL